MKYTFSILLVLILFQSSAQNYANIWHFGENQGLDFNGGAPVVINGENNGVEGCSTISNENGELLFYTNSDSVWNSQHQVMPNGQIGVSAGSISQTIIIPKPLSVDEFYIFTAEVQSGVIAQPYLKYHEIDMNLDGGLGDVTNSTDITTALNITEQICATQHSNGIDIWVMTHEYGTNNFLAYLVSPSGVASNPVISSVGPSHTSCLSNLNARGTMKFSPNGGRVAFNANGIGSTPNTDLLCLFDFDNSTGLVSSPINLPYCGGEYGLSFSPDNSKLYCGTEKSWIPPSEFNYLYQFDLSSNDPTTIVASKTIIDSVSVDNSTYGCMQIGPDGKIYVRISSSTYIGVINSPNDLGINCNFFREAIDLGGVAYYQTGLNNTIELKSLLSLDDLHTKPQKTLVGITDLLGRETENSANTVLIYHYSDGTAKKVLRVE